jgi:hypothetical protein
MKITIIITLLRTLYSKLSYVNIDMPFHSIELSVKIDKKKTAFMMFSWYITRKIKSVYNNYNILIYTLTLDNI